MLRLALLLALLLLPSAAAVDTLSTFEEPHEGTDKVYEVVVTAEEAGRNWTVIFRNLATASFGFVVYDRAGNTLYDRTGARGVQSLPALEAGPHKLFVRRTGEFQLVPPERALGRGEVSDIDANLSGTDAYVFSSPRSYRLNVSGDVKVDFWDITMRAVRYEEPFSRDLRAGFAYVLTVRGEEGTPYSFRFEEIETPPPATPTPSAPTQNEDVPLASALVVLALALAAFARRR